MVPFFTQIGTEHVPGDIPDSHVEHTPNLGLYIFVLYLTTAIKTWISFGNI